MKPKKIDSHTRAAIEAAEREYFIIAETSQNEAPGLLVGTAVRKIAEPKSRPSCYWRGSYWSVLVECPNGEERNISVDCILPGAEILFRQQQTMFGR